MGTIVLEARLEQSTILPGESCPVESALRNETDAPVTVHTSGSPSPLVYQLLHPEDMSAVHTFTVDRYNAVVDPDVRGDEGRETAPLAPGQEVVFHQDLAEIASSELAPGSYLLRVQYSLEGTPLSSDPLPLAVAPPDVGSLVAVADNRSDTIAAIFTHRADDGARVYQRETEVGNPVLGVTWGRKEIASADTSVAVALDSSSDLAGRWAAWISDGSLFAIRSWDASIVATEGPVATELQGAQLLPVGRKLADGRGLFLLSGTGQNGQAVDQLTLEGAIVPTPPEESEPGGITPPPPPPAPPPEVQRYELDGRVETIAPRFFPEEGPLQLVTSQADNDGTVLSVRDFPAGTSRILYESEAPLAALGVPPLQAPGAGYADALFGPFGDERIMAYVRVSLDATGGPEAAPHTWYFSENDLRPEPKLGQEPREWAPEEPIVTRWALTSGQVVTPPVLALVEDRVLAGRPTVSPLWQPLVDGVDTATAMALVAFLQSDNYDRKEFALIAAGSAGFRTVALP